MSIAAVLLIVITLAYLILFQLISRRDADRLERANGGNTLGRFLMAAIVTFALGAFAVYVLASNPDSPLPFLQGPSYDETTKNVGAGVIGSITGFWFSKV
jgi:hypothetical protein